MTDQPQESDTEDLDDLNWKECCSVDLDQPKKKAFNNFTNLAKGVIQAINEDAEWLKLVSYPQ